MLKSMEKHFTTIGEVRRLNSHLNADILKLSAIVIMLIDHIGAFLVDQNASYYWTMRGIGRLAFPIFCFMVAEGAYYTRSMPKYLARMAAFALISIPPFNLVQGEAWYAMGYKNVFFTLFFGLLAIYSVSGLPGDIFKKIGKAKLAENRLLCVLLGLPLCVLCYFAAYWLNTDYGEYGVAAILVFWLLRKRPVAAWLGYAALTIVFFCFLIIKVSNGMIIYYESVTFYGVIKMLFTQKDLGLYFYPQPEMLAVLALIPCLLYNGKKGFSKGNSKSSVISKYAFYAFYPVHLWCIWFVQLVLR